MGSLWGLVIEMVDSNVSLKVWVDGECEANKELLLRLCTPPMPSYVPFTVEQGAKRIRMQLDFGRIHIETFLNLPRMDGPKVDLVCMLESNKVLQADVDENVAKNLAENKFDGAIAALGLGVNGLQTIGRDMIDVLGEDEYNVSEIKTDIDRLIVLFQAQATEIHANRHAYDAMRDVQARAYSRASTVRANGVSIDPGAGRTQSELQRVLSE